MSNKFVHFSPWGGYPKLTTFLCSVNYKYPVERKFIQKILAATTQYGEKPAGQEVISFFVILSLTRYESACDCQAGMGPLLTLIYLFKIQAFMIPVA